MHFYILLCGLNVKDQLNKKGALAPFYLLVYSTDYLFILDTLIAASSSAINTLASSLFLIAFKTLVLDHSGYFGYFYNRYFKAFILVTRCDFLLGIRFFLVIISLYNN